MPNILVGATNSTGSYTFDASAKTVTFSGLGTISLDQIRLITNVTDGIIIYQFNSTTKGGSLSGSVLTLDHDTTAMEDTDILAIDFNYGSPTTDYTLAVEKTIEQSPIWSRYTDPETLVTAQDLTASYADYGSEIDVRGYNRLGVYIVADVNDSTNVKLQVLGKHTSAGTDEYDVDGISQQTLWTTGASDFKRYYEFDIGTMPYVQLQAFAGAVGGTAGDLSIVIDKKWRN